MSKFIKNKHIQNILKWVMLGIICVMILVGAIVAYLFISDMFYQEERAILIIMENYH